MAHSASNQDKDTGLARAINRLTWTIWIILIVAVLLVPIVIWLASQTLVPK